MKHSINKPWLLIHTDNGEILMTPRKFNTSQVAFVECPHHVFLGDTLDQCLTYIREKNLTLTAGDIPSTPDTDASAPYF